MAYKQSQYTDYVEHRMSQLPLAKGDAVFFNPACLHQPGKNHTDSPRVANLLQISACWGTPMETTNKLAMVRSLWPVMKEWDTERINRDQSTDGVSGVHLGQDKHPMQLEALIRAGCDDYGYARDFDNMPVRIKPSVSRNGFLMYRSRSCVAAKPS